MNIKKHIEAGHYPTDEKGRALVPMRDGPTATILATDVGDNWTVVGHCLGQVYRWNDIGISRSSEPGYAGQLLPPPPRKVEVKRWAEVRLSDRTVLVVFASSCIAAGHGNVMVELTGSYDEPWS